MSLFSRVTRTHVVVVITLVLFFARPAVAADPTGDPWRGDDRKYSTWWKAVHQQISAEEYWISWQGSTSPGNEPDGFACGNRVQGFRAVFTEQGVRVTPRVAGAEDWELQMSLLGWGRTDSLQALGAPELSAASNRMDFRHERVSQWFENDIRGLQFGYLVHDPPTKRSETSVDLVLDLEIKGKLAVNLIDRGQQVVLDSAGGDARLRMVDLLVLDATDSVLPARFGGFAREGRSGIRILVDDWEGLYPLTVSFVLEDTTWSWEGSAPGGDFGASLGSVGDINGDGFSDIIVGAPDFDNGEASEGKVFVYYGSPAGPSTVADWSAESNQADAYLGESVGAAGDVNGDGYGDIIVSAHRYQDSYSNEGGVFIWYGGLGSLGSDGTPANADWSAFGGMENARLGISVACAGNLNGDGYSDIVVGAHWYSQPESHEGGVFVFYGSDTGPSLTPDWSAESNQANAQIGFSVNAAGDVNGDGYSDLIAGARWFDHPHLDEGSAFLWLGSGSGLGANGTPANADWVGECDQAGAEYGTSVGTAGDVDGDGYADVIVGAPGYAEPNSDEGGAFLYLGSDVGLQTTEEWMAQSDQIAARLGASVATAGDVNGDGYADVIVGAPDFDNGQTDEGAVFVWHGSPAGLGADGLPANAHWSAESDQAGASFGSAVALAGDVDGDGLSDILVGAPLFDGTAGADSGLVRIYAGRTSSASEMPSWMQSYPIAGFAGDVNGDGYTDIVVGDGVSVGLAFGSPDGPGTTLDWSYLGNGIGLKAVASAGDVNGDGFDDIMATGTNGVFFFYGSPSGPAAAPDWVAYGEPAGNSNFGGRMTALATAGDVNGDGYCDVIIGDPERKLQNVTLGAYYVFHGSPTGLDANGSRTDGREWNADWKVFGETDLIIGSHVSGAGDVNGDGYSDVIMWKQDVSLGEDSAGAAWVYLGGPQGLSGDGSLATADWMAQGNEMTLFASLAAGAGDVNGDGYSDIVIGAPWATNVAFADGAAFFWFGSAAGMGPDGTPDNADSVIYGGVNGRGQTFGDWVAPAGDVNGDGYADVLILEQGLSSPDSKSYLFFGSATGPSDMQEGTFTGNDYPFSSASHTAGDTNGDGYADLLLMELHNENYLFYGNGGPGLTVRPRQNRADDTAPIALLGASESFSSFGLSAMGRTPFGRAKIAMQWEVKPLGAAFDGTGTGVSASLVDTDVTGVVLDETVSGLAGGSPYHWRLRFLYDPVTAPYQQTSRWFSVPVNGWSEQDLKVLADSDGDGIADPHDNCPDVANPTQLLSTIGDFVWLDLDGDGIQDQEEPVFYDYFVFLFDDQGRYEDYATSAYDGSYLFDAVCPGGHILEFWIPSGYLFTPQDQGGDDTLDSDVDPTTGEAVFTIGAGETDLTIDCGVATSAFLFADGFESGDTSAWNVTAR